MCLDSLSLGSRRFLYILRQHTLFPSLKPGRSQERAKVTVYDHQLDVTTPLLKAVMDRMVLIRRDVEEDLQKCLFVCPKLRVEIIRVHLIRSALAWQEFTAVIVYFSCQHTSHTLHSMEGHTPQADVIRNLNSPLDSADQSRQQGLRIQVRRLDEDTPLCVPHQAQECLVLRYEHALIVDVCIRFSRAHGHGHSGSLRCWDEGKEV